MSANDTGAVLSGIDSITLLDTTKFPISNWLGDAEETGQSSSPVIIVNSIASEDSKKIQTSIQDDKPKRKITRKAKYRCQICPGAFFRREHRRNIHMHEFHSTQLSATELESYPLPENYTKKAEVKINDNAENSLQENINGIVSPNENTNIDIRQEKKRLRFKYHCDECNHSFKKLERFNEHRNRYHKLKPVNEDYGKNGYQCDYCSRIFSSRWNLERHTAIHLGHRKFRCRECGKSFFRNEELKKHEMRHNSQQERKNYGKIACYSCGVPMRVKPGEKCKIPSCHSDREGIRTFITCKTCGEQFTNEKSYSLHILEHGKDVMSEHDYNTMLSSDDNSLAEDESDFVIVQSKHTTIDETKRKITTIDEAKRKHMTIDETKRKSGKENGDVDEDDDKSNIKENRDESVDVDKRSNEIDEEIDVESVEVVNQQKQSPNARSKRLKTENLVQTEKKENKPDDDDASNAPKVVKIIGNWGRRKKRYEKIDYEGAFQCKICEKFFSTNYIMKRHALMHTKPEKVKCEECGCYFIRKSLLDRHTARMHGTTNLSQEVVVIKALKLPEAKAHRSASSRACVADKNILKTEDDEMERELKTSDTEYRRKRSSNCVGCGDEACGSDKSPSKSQKLEIPVIVKQEDATKDTDPKSIEGFVFAISDKSHENYTCKKCMKKFRYQNEYVNHQLIHSSKKKVFPCGMCSLVFVTPDNLMKHQQKHDKNGNFSCDRCTFLTDSYEHLTRHRASHKQKKSAVKCRTDQKVAICDQCGKECATVHRLREHLLTHTGEKPFKCTTCKKTFHTLNILKNHENTHLDIKPFMCDECGRTFCQASTLSTHKLTHVPKKLGCKLCPSKFRNPAALNFHLVSQHPNAAAVRQLNVLKCETCDKTFLRQRDLDRHIRTHTGEKPFICKFKDCDKGFSDRSNCISHEKSHEPTKHKCNHCDKEYVYQRDLKKHVKKLHPNVDVQDNENELGEQTDHEGQVCADVRERQGQIHSKNISVECSNISSDEVYEEDPTKIIDLENNDQDSDRNTKKGDVTLSDDSQTKDKIQDQNGINNPELSSISSTATESERLQEIVSSSAGDGQSQEDFLSTVGISDSNVSHIVLDSQTGVEDILLQTNDSENGQPSTIYVVQTMSDSEEECKVIYLVKQN